MFGYSHRPQDRAVLLAALVVPFSVALALVPFRTGLSATNEALIMVVAVVAVAALGTRAVGAPAALSAAAWFDFFLTGPHQQFAIADGDEIRTAVLLLVVGLIVSQPAVRVQRLRTVADASHLSSLQGTARLVEDGASPEASPASRGGPPGRGRASRSGRCRAGHGRPLPPGLTGGSRPLAYARR
ncbi:DUF4118 domain-containing protein [Streptomyces virginiae]|uniref:DUF4118 domain-containing protein n=1 Tax=Streptomyces virginiae TaxID=1961 RepID=UPI00225537DA|nr:DUF4118 domain-containing protein [Streptomyces virginiae]MCX5175345.1 DUF4118 domain-containing protein [Streptomyces virginiae]